MYCPKCKHNDTQVVDTRDVDRISIRRRRECPKCHYRFTTYETIDLIKITVIKKDGRKEAYDRSKILRGLELSTQKRNITEHQLSDIVDAVEFNITARGKPIITSHFIGDIVSNELKKIDTVAYIRFTSVYKDFQTSESFKKELEALNNTKSI